MGRVYNALLKAERWGDRARPARPAAPAHNEKAIPVAEPVKEREPRPAPQPETATTPALKLDDRAMGLPLDFNDQPGLGELLSATSEVSHLRVAPTPPPAAVFTEPRESVNISALSLDPHLAAITCSDELASERYRTLAVRLFNLSARRKLKTLLVTSAHEGEGKTTIATNLAWVMTKRSERRVLLIDADLRCPSVGRALGLTASKGWLDIVEGKCELADAAIRLDPNGLYVLVPQATGERHRDSLKHPASAEASDALTSSRVEKLIGELERHFDFIIIDAPPILEFADAQRLAAIVDGSALVVRAGQTHHTAVTDALKLVPKERRVGVVLNDAQVTEEISYNNRKKKGFFGGKK